MRFTLTYTSQSFHHDDHPPTIVDLASLDDLLALVRREGQPVIVLVDEEEPLPRLEVYDAYRE